jgi:ADP-ribose pyrophosphatase YjhB (NUDIX family)
MVSAQFRSRTAPRSTSGVDVPPVMPMRAWPAGQGATLAVSAREVAAILGPMSTPRLRTAVRAVLLDPDDRILLVRFVFPDRSVWACPGGGIEPGESDEHALRRELAEETGLEDPRIGACVWVREHVIPLFGGRWDGQRERFYLVRTPAFEPRPHFDADELAAEFVTDIRWWTIGELQHSDALFAPRRLPQLVADLVGGAAPEAPIDAGV